MSAREPIAVAILTARRPGKLLACLRTLAAGTRRPDEVIVVLTDTADAATREALAKRTPKGLRVRLLEHDGGAYAEARNRACAEASAPLLAFLDDDCLADRYWLERLAGALATADAVGGLVLPVEEISDEDQPDYSPELAWLVGCSPPGLIDDAVGATYLPSTSNLGLRIELWRAHPFQDLGGAFAAGDAANYLLGREDAEWWETVRRAGRRCAVVPRAIVRHDFDPVRYATDAMAERAENDGHARWARRRQREDLAPAAADVANTPFRVADALARERFDSLGVAWTRERLWARRQAALLESAVDDLDACVSPQWRTGAILREAARGTFGIAKRAVRTVAARAHHGLKTIRPLPTQEQPPARVLVALYDFLGDAVLTLPMLEALRATYPQARVTLLTGEAGAQLAEGAPHLIDRAIELPTGLSAMSPRAVRRVWRAVRAARPDAIIAAYWHAAPPLPLFAATDAPVVCWERDQGFGQEMWAQLAQARVPKSLDKAEVAALLDLTGALDVRATLRRSRWTPPDRARDRVSRLAEKLGLEWEQCALLHIDGPEDGHKSWPSEKWCALANELRARGLRVVVVGTRAGKGRFESMADAMPKGTRSLHGVLDVAELGAAQERAAVCVGPDSGPQHLAQAVGARVVVLFGSTDERRWGPLPRIATDGDAVLAHRIVRAAPFDWRGHETRGFARNEHLRRIDVETVVAACDAVMDAASARASSSEL